MANIKDTQAIFTALTESRNKAKMANPATIKKESKEVITESPDVKMFTGSLLRESEDVADDILDNIVVVTDPDKTVDDLEVRADEIQDAIDGTPEGEAAFSDEYVGDKVYACPICGESFFADEDYVEGDMCPICKAEPQDGFLAQGVVAPAQPEEDIIDDAEAVPVDDDVKPEEDVIEDDVVKDDVVEPEDETKEESVEPKYKKECAEADAAIEIEVDLNDNTVEISKPTEVGVDIDECSFDDALDQFVEENYKKSLKSLKVKECFYNNKEDVLELECEAVTAKDVKVPITLKMTESRARDNKALLKAVESTKAFKIESKTPAFTFRVVRENNVITCESMSYSYVTNHHSAGKVKVEGFCRARKDK